MATVVPYLGNTHWLDFCLENRESGKNVYLLHVSNVRMHTIRVCKISYICE
jgi:hypothetical protein